MPNPGRQAAGQLSRRWRRWKGMLTSREPAGLGGELRRPPASCRHNCVCSASAPGAAGRSYLVRDAVGWTDLRRAWRRRQMGLKPLPICASKANPASSAGGRHLFQSGRECDAPAKACGGDGRQRVGTVDGSAARAASRHTGSGYRDPPARATSPQSGLSTVCCTDRRASMPKRDSDMDDSFRFRFCTPH